ncbi:hypothetical protein F5Y10DRAFT_123056 [Nemania abortiva]|nr:hypothetical protein F5Y10DRAFT_123056 [Nemania abortiva]
MAKRRVIADSEDEDEGDDVLFLPEGDFDRPEPEPLSPLGRPSSAAAPESHHDQLNVTDSSFLAEGYDDQKSLTVRQSHLIEHIVRQSQRASASSGDVSLPAQKRRRADRSSGTDVTSPTAPKRARNRTTLLSDSVSEFTTPRKSTGQEWEIPSSPEDETASNRAKSLSRSKEKTYGNNKKRKSRLVSSPVAPKMVATEETGQRAALEDIGVDNQSAGGQGTDAATTPAAKRAKVSQHDPTLPDTTKFYIAQSNLTTMQKLEYQKVNVSLNGYGGLPGSLPNQKSSGATIAYSTPRGYSPVPLLPWEEPPEQPPSPLPNKVINISSSPDVIDSGFNLPAERNPVARLETDMATPRPNKNRRSVGNGKRAAQIAEDDDELWKDEIGDMDQPDLPPISYKPRVTKRKSIAAGPLGAENNTDAFEGIPALPDTDPPPLSDADPPSLPDTDPLELPDTQPQEPQEPPEPSPEVIVKKRGRKKAQPVAEIPSEETEATEESHLKQDPASPRQETEAEPLTEKPKKRRGRPRKSEPPKAAEELLPEPHVASELPRADSSQKNNNPDESGAITREQENTGQKRKRGRRKAIEEIEDIQSKDDRLALKEVDSNLKTPKLDSAVESPTKTRVEPNDDESTPKKVSRETPKPAASQPKVKYRVGLSKRSRITPLLKSIKK